MKNYSKPVIKLYCFITTDVLTASDENVNISNENDTDVVWGGKW